MAVVHCDMLKDCHGRHDPWQSYCRCALLNGRFYGCGAAHKNAQLRQYQCCERTLHQNHRSGLGLFCWKTPIVGIRVKFDRVVFWFYQILPVFLAYFDLRRTVFYFLKIADGAKSFSAELAYSCRLLRRARSSALYLSVLEGRPLFATLQRLLRAHSC